MQEHIILPSKRRVDVHRIEAPFDQLLQDGEVLVSGECSVVVFSGVDADPEHMLVGEVQVQGTSLYQQIRLGIPGVIYLLTFTATTSEGNLYEVTAKQAVLEDQIPAGPIYTYTYLTSTPYPLENVDGFASTIDSISALYLSIPIDGINSTFTISSGSLRDILLNYECPPEGINSSDFDLVSGELHQILLTYEAPPEGIDSTGFDLVSGALYGARVAYTNWPGEGINSTFDIVSGTLT